MKKLSAYILLLLVLAYFPGHLFSATIPVGSGSYTDTLPGGKPTPPTSIYKTSNISGPIPTNDWWTSAISSTYSYRMFAYPSVYKCDPTGLLIGYPDVNDSASVSYYGSDSTAPYRQQLLVRTKNNFSSNDTKVDGYGDWTATTYWEDPGNPANNFKATIGQGLPFSYFVFSLNISTAQIAFPLDWAQGQLDIYDSSGSQLAWNTVYNTDRVTVRFLHYSSGKVKYFGVFAPQGASFKMDSTGHVLDIIFPATDRFLSVAPMTGTADLSVFYNYAYAFVTNTQSSFSVNDTNSTLSTVFTVTTSSKRLAQSQTIIALFPHQWKNSSNGYLSQTYSTLRGTMKLKAGNSFTVNQSFNGILPMLPDKGDYNKTTLQVLLNNDKNSSLGSTGTYYHGKELWRLASLLPIADQLGDSSSRDLIISRLKTDLTNWFTYTNGESNKYFYYNSFWGTMIGYDAESQFHSENLNDHHFHYGYFIYASAMLAMYDADFKNNYGGMVEHLIRDIASPNRSDSMYPYLRNFSPYEGHSWADGMAQSDDGNNQESSSEAMNAWAGIYLWGKVTANDTYRQLGIYLHTTEYSAIKEYYFNIDQDTYGSGYLHNTVGQVFGGKITYNTWFGSDPEYIHGIQFIPTSPSHLYLGYNPAYCQANYNHMVSQNGGTETVWQDLMWQYQAFYDPASAISKYDSTSFPDLNSSTKTYLYYFLHNLNVLGKVDTGAYTREGTSAVFDNGGVKTYVCYNSAGTWQNINFYSRSGDSYLGQLEVGPNQARASSDITPPSEVTGASVNAGLTLGLSWSNPSSDYSSTVIRKSISGYPATHRDGTQVYGDSGTSFVDTDVTLGTTYYYKIFTVDPAGNYSLAGVSVQGFPVDLVPPAQVSDFSAQTGANAGEINLSWSMPGDNGWAGTLSTGSKFAIQYSTNSSYPWSRSTAQICVSTQGVIPLTSVSYTVGSLTGGATYYLKIWHCDTCQNWSGISNTASASAKAQVYTGDFTCHDVSANLTSVREGTLSWADFNKDGKLDLAVCGNYSTKIYRNDSGSFTDIGSILSGVFMASLDWGDFNNDGYPDLAVCGYTGTDVITKIYRNNGDGTFTDIGAGLLGVYSGAVKWVDYDKDGYLDLAVCGWGPGGNETFTKIYHNNRNGTFTEINAGLPGVCWASMAWGDYNNDGYPDLALTGCIFSPYHYITKIFRNNGDGTFTDINAGLTGVEFGASAWGDYNKDGYLDLAVSGMIEGNNKDSITKIYRNNGNGTFTDINAGLMGGFYSSLDWGDFNNDGYPDLAFCGWNYAAGRVTKIYRNDAGTLHEVVSNLPGVDEGSIKWGDFDSDGNLDIALCGNTGTEIIARIYRNDCFGASKMMSPPAQTKNVLKAPQAPAPPPQDTVPPSAVANLSASSSANEGEVILRWSTPGNNGTTGVLVAGSKAAIQYSTYSSVSWSTASAQVSFSTSGVFPLADASVRVSALSDGTTYYFALWYCDESQNWSSVSNIAAAKAQADLSAPAPAGGLTASTGQTNGDISLSWSSPGDNGWVGTLKPGAKFKVEYSTSAMTVSEQYSVVVSTFGVAPKTTVFYELSGLQDSTTYYIGILYSDSANNYSGISNIVSAVTMPAAAKKLSQNQTIYKVPVAIENISAGMHTVDLIWQAGGASSYAVLKSTNNCNWITLADNLPVSSSNSYTDSGLYPSTTYYYAVCGYTASYSQSASTSMAVAVVTQGLPSNVNIILASSPKDQVQGAVSPVLGSIKVDVPPGAVKTDGYILINPSAENVIGASQVPRYGFSCADKEKEQGSKLIARSEAEFHYYDLTGSTVTENFAKPVELILSYPDIDGDGYVDTESHLNVSTLRVCLLNSQTMKWEVVPGGQQIDKFNRTVTAKLEHFSIYALASIAAYAQDLANVVVYPNPYRPGSGGAYDDSLFGRGIVFDKLTEKARIRIYNVAGELIAEIEKDDNDSKKLWNAENQSGNKVASGVYIYYISNPANSSQKARGKLAIER